MSALLTAWCFVRCSACVSKSYSKGTHSMQCILCPGLGLHLCLTTGARGAVAERPHPSILQHLCWSQIREACQRLTLPPSLPAASGGAGEGLKTVSRQLLHLIAHLLLTIVAESFLLHFVCSCSRSCLRAHRPTSGASSQTSSCGSRAVRARSMLLATLQQLSRSGLLTAQALGGTERPSW